MSDEIKQIEVPVVETSQPDPKEVQKENNLRAIARKLEETERRAKEAENRAIQYERELHNRQQYQQQPQEPIVIDDEDFGDPDDVALNKTVVKTTKKIKAKQTEAEQKIASLEEKLSILEARAEINSLKDFNEVVNDENMKTLAVLYPDEYETIRSTNNLRSKSKLAYNMIKNYGIAQATPIIKRDEQIKAVEKKIETNNAKPGSSASMPSPSALTKFGRYDADGRLIMSEEDAKRINAETRRKIMGTYN